MVFTNYIIQTTDNESEPRMRMQSSPGNTARPAPHTLNALAFAAMALCASRCLAVDTGQPAFSFNGFGTLSFAHSSENRGDYTFDNLQPNGVGRSRNWSPDVDSRIGGQVTANVNSELSAVLQIVSEYRWNDTYTPFVNWANIKYAFTPDFSVRFGRIALASFLASDSRKVGYSNPTGRPPIEVYRLLALNNSDGVDAVYRFHVGDATNSTTLLYGKKTVTNTRGIDVHSTGVKGIFDTLEYGSATLHAAYQERNVDNQAPPLGKFMSLGASYDPGKWFASGEWVKVINFDGKGLKVIRAGWYVNGGVRIGAFTPFVTFSELRPLTDTGVTPAAQRTAATGVRWDFMRNVDLKLQYDHINLGEGSYGTLQNVLPGTPTGGKVNIVSVFVDFVF